MGATGLAGLSAWEGIGLWSLILRSKAACRRYPNCSDIPRSSKKDELLITPCPLLLSSV
jgi:hypothetical protein